MSHSLPNLYANPHLIFNNPHLPPFSFPLHSVFSSHCILFPSHKSDLNKCSPSLFVAAWRLNNIRRWKRIKYRFLSLSLSIMLCIEFEEFCFGPVWILFVLNFFFWEGFVLKLYYLSLVHICFSFKIKTLLFQKKNNNKTLKQYKRVAIPLPSPILYFFFWGEERIYTFM